MHTFLIPYNLQALPSANKYRSPNSSIHETPLQHNPDHPNPTKETPHQKPIRAKTFKDNSVTPAKIADFRKGRVRSGTEGDPAKIDEIIRRFRKEESSQKITGSARKIGHVKSASGEELRQLLEVVAEAKKSKQEDAGTKETTRDMSESNFQSSAVEISRLTDLVRFLSSEVTVLQGQLIQQHSQLTQLEAAAKERDELKRRLNDTLTRKDCENLARTIQELEEMQNALIRENTELKQELIRVNRKSTEMKCKQGGDLSLVVELASKDIRIVQKELGQIANFLESFHRGDFNPDFQVDRSESETDCNIDIFEEMKRVKGHLGKVKVLVEDLYAEYCGTRCATQ